MPTKTVTPGKNIYTLALVLSANIILMSPLSAFADGKKLLKQCETIVAYKEGEDISKLSITDTEDAMYCLGYVQGTMDMNHFYQRSIGDNAMFCMPGKDMSQMDAVKLVIAFLKAHPDRLKEEESYLVQSAFSEKFPCKSPVRKKKK